MPRVMATVQISPGPPLISTRPGWSTSHWTACRCAHLFGRIAKPAGAPELFTRDATLEASRPPNTTPTSHRYGRLFASLHAPHHQKQALYALNQRSVTRYAIVGGRLLRKMEAICHKKRHLWCTEAEPGHRHAPKSVLFHLKSIEAVYSQDTLSLT